LALVLLFALIMGINNYAQTVTANQPAVETTQAGSAEQYAERYPVDRLGQALLGDFLVPFELASVLLLVVMIGAAYLAKGRRREEDVPAQVTRTGVALPTTGVEG